MNHFIGSWSVVNPCLDTLERFNENLLKAVVLSIWPYAFYNISASKITLRPRKVIVDNDIHVDNLIVVLLFGNSLLSALQSTVP